jgi:hypothetical protein
LSLPSDVAGVVLRWNVRLNALIGLFRDVKTNEATGITCIFLNADGSKKERKFQGVIGGAAVKLSEPESGLLAIAEGVETALAAQQLGIGPTWALGSSGAIAAFPVLPNILTLIICAEIDDASSHAVAACAERWHRAGIDVMIAEPGVDGDMNDAVASGSGYLIEAYRPNRSPRLGRV